MAWNLLRCSFTTVQEPGEGVISVTLLVTCYSQNFLQLCHLERQSLVRLGERGLSGVSDSTSSHCWKQNFSHCCQDVKEIN